MGLMDRLNLSGRITKILLRTTDQETDLEVAGLDSGWYCEMEDIFTQLRMLVNMSNIPGQEDLHKWPQMWSFCSELRNHLKSLGVWIKGPVPSWLDGKWTSWWRML